jgi:chemotaxis-related protein WspB
MLLLMFRVSGSLFALNAARVREVVPRVEPRAVPHAPEFLTGLFDYRGRVVPAVDLGLLLGSAACRPLLSTRVIVVETAGEGHSGRVLLGLVAEEVSDVREVGRDQVAFPATPLERAPYLGPIVRVDEGLVQLIEPDHVLTGTPLAASFGGLAEAT